MKPESQPAAEGVAFEQHFTPVQLAKLWAVDPKTVREWCQEEPDIMAFGKVETRFGKPYISLRIPKSVAARIHARQRVR